MDEAVASIEWRTLLFVYFNNSFFGLYFLNAFKNLGHNFTRNDYLLTLIAVSVFVGRLVLRQICTVANYNKTKLSVLLGVQIICMILISLSNNWFVYLVTASLCLSTYSGNFTLITREVAHCFGFRTGTNLYIILAKSRILAVGLTILINKYWLSYFGYSYKFALFIVSSMLALCLFHVYYPENIIERSWTEECNEQLVK